MLISIKRMLRDLQAHTGGSAILLTAIGLPILIGGAGMAVDFSQWYSWKRELQQATDQDRKSTRLNSSHLRLSRMPSSA